MVVIVKSEGETDTNKKRKNDWHSGHSTKIKLRSKKNRFIIILGDSEKDTALFHTVALHKKYVE